MENGLINLINSLPEREFAHVILCLTHATRFRERIRRDGVEIIECRKPAGKHLPTYWKVYQELKRLKPDIVHTRNLGALDMTWVARVAGCAWRIHSEHGWSPEDPQGRSKKYRAFRRLCDPAINHYVAVSRNIANWLTNVIGIADSKIATLHNGVDLQRFLPVERSIEAPVAKRNHQKVVFGTLGRQDAIKGLDVFLTALHILLEERPEWRERLRVVMAGDGDERDRCERLRARYGLDAVVEFPGEVEDVPQLLGQFDFFVQPSLNEGISNTVLEAMASGLPVIATNVGGNPELVRDGVDGCLVPPGDAHTLCAALATYIDDSALRLRQGASGRQRAENSFSLEAMTRNYERLYSQIPSSQSSAAT